MLKKILAMTLCIAMLLSVSAFAAVTTDEVTGMVIATDNFETEDGYTADQKRNSNANNLLTSSIFAGAPPEATTSYGYSTSYAREGKGTNGSMGLEIGIADGNYTTRFVMTKDLEIGADTNTKIYELSYDVKTTDTSGAVYLGAYGSRSIDGGLFRLTKNGNIFVFENGAFVDSGIAFESDAWYHVDVVASGKNRYGYLTTEGGDALFASRTGVTKPRINLEIHGSTSSSGRSSTLKVYLDNVKLVEFEPANIDPAVVQAPQVSGKTNIQADTVSTVFTANQLLNTESKAILTPADGEAAECSISVDASAPYAYKIAFPALAEGEEYTLDLSGIESVSGEALPETAVYTFKTVAAAIDLLSSTIENGARDVSEEIKEMTVTFTREAVNPPATVSITGGKAPITATVTTNDNTEFTFDWSSFVDDLQGLTEYTIDLSEFVGDDGLSSKTPAITFTTQSTAVVKITDDFESVLSTDTGYNTLDSKGNRKNPAIPLTTGEGNASGYVSSVAGYEGNGSAIKVITKTSGSCVNPIYLHEKITPAQNVTETGTQYEQIVVTYRFNFAKFADHGTVAKWNKDAVEGKSRGAQIRFLANKSKSGGTPVARIISYNEPGKCYFNSIGQETTYPDAEVIENHWYNIIWTIDGTQQTFMVVDAEGTNKGRVVFKNSVTSTGYTAGDALTVVPIAVGRQKESNGDIWNENLNVLADDFTVWRIKPWKMGNAMNETADKVITQTALGAKCDFAFDQPVVLNKSMFSIADSENNETFEFTYPDFTKATAYVTDLNQNQEYTVDYSGVKSAGKAGFGDTTVNKLYRFTSGELQDEAQITSATYIGFNKDDVLYFNVSSKSYLTGRFIIAFYNAENPGKIEAIKLMSGRIVPGSNSFGYTFSEAVNADSAKIYVWSYADGFVPVATNYMIATQVQSAN